MQNQNQNKYWNQNQNQNDLKKVHKKKKLRRKSDEECKIGQGLKILTPDQMLHSLPISLAQVKSENNLEKLKNEIRQLLHHLYCLKN